MCIKLHNITHYASDIPKGRFSSHTVAYITYLIVAPGLSLAFSGRRSVDFRQTPELFPGLSLPEGQELVLQCPVQVQEVQMFYARRLDKFLQEYTAM